MLIKDLYDKLAGLTRDELRKIVIVPLGERLEQGAKYIDLQHLEQGEFVATADMLSDEDHNVPFWMPASVHGAGGKKAARRQENPSIVAY